MEFDGGKSELLGNLRVFYFTGLVDRKTFDTLGHVRTRSDSASTAKRFELDVRDDTLIVDTYLQLHNVATSVSVTKQSKEIWTIFFLVVSPFSLGGASSKKHTQVRRRAQYRRLHQSLGANPPRCKKAKKVRLSDNGRRNST